jgi:hypothetical protein
MGKTAVILMLRSLLKIISCSVLVLMLFPACLTKQEIPPEKLINEEVNAFFREWAKEGTNKAYFRTHSSFQKETSLRIMDFLSRVYKINTMIELEIIETGIKKNVGSVQLNIYDNQHVILPVRVHLGQEQNKWRIINFDFDTKTYLINSGMKNPEPEEMIELAVHYLRIFHNAAKDFNINQFYREISTLWQNNTKPENLLHSYRELFENHKFKQQNLREVETLLHPSSGLRDTGLLFIKGRFISGIPIDFEMEFFYEDFKWKAVSLGLNV